MTKLAMILNMSLLWLGGFNLRSALMFDQPMWMRIICAVVGIVATVEGYIFLRPNVRGV